MYWKCPNCKSKVDFEKQLKYVFDEKGEAEFDPETGLWLHTIECGKCDAEWTMSVSKMYLVEPEQWFVDDEEEGTLF